MDELDLIIAYADLTTLQTQLQEWKLKSKTPEIFENLETRIIESQVFFRALEKELRSARQRTSDLELNVLKLTAEVERLNKENDELKDLL